MKKLPVGTTCVYIPLFIFFLSQNNGNSNSNPEQTILT